VIAIGFLSIGLNALNVNHIPRKLKITNQISDFFVLPTATPDTICPGMTSQLMANPNGGTPPISYIWSPDTGLNDPTSPNPIASPTSTITYLLLATDASMQTAIDSVTVFVKNPPQTHGLISGPSNVCMDSTETYSIAEVYGSTSYSWTVPQGDTIINGQNTIQVSIKWSGPSGPVSVIAGNECGNSNPSVLTVTIEQIPVIIENIVGPESACIHEKMEFSIVESPGATNYSWTVPDDALIIDGQGTTSIDIIWGSNSGNITVIAENFCGSSEPKNKSIVLENVPEPAGVITGKDSVCQNHSNYNYFIPLIPNTIIYQWNLPEGAEITDGKGTNSITIFFSSDATSGSISVFGENRCGKGNESVKEIFVSSCMSINDNKTPELFCLYPNPAKNEITITIQGDDIQGELAIKDITGRLQIFEELKVFPTLNSKKLNISKLAPGIYFIHLTGNNKSLTRMFIVQ